MARPDLTVLAIPAFVGAMGAEFWWQRRNPAAQLGDLIEDELPPVDFGRIAAQTAKQVIVQKVRDAERDRMFEEYKDRVHEIVNGIVKRVEYGNVIVDLGRGEAIVRRDELLPRETFRNGDRVSDLQQFKPVGAYSHSLILRRRGHRGLH